jgi:hypothetical protein
MTTNTATTTTAPSAARERDGFPVELPRITVRDLAAYAREGKRRRDEEIAKLFRAAGRGLARVARGTARLVTAHGRGIGAMIPQGGLGHPAR